jgi:hypothetical protein
MSEAAAATTGQVLPASNRRSPSVVLWLPQGVADRLIATSANFRSLQVP